MGPLALLLGLLGLVPGASAAIVPSHFFEGLAHVSDLEQLGGNEGSGNSDVLLWTGAAAATGPERGLFLFLSNDRAVVSNVTRVEVYDSSGNAASIDPKEFNQTRRPIHKAYEDATITFPRHGTFLAYAESRALEFDAATPFAFSLAIRPPADLGGGVINITENREVVLVGNHTRFDGQMRGASSTALLLSTDATRPVAIAGGGKAGNFTGNKFVYRIYQNADFDTQGQGIGLPLRGNTSVTFTPAEGKDFRDNFNLTAINDVVQEISKSTKAASGNSTQDEPKDLLPKDLAETIGSIGPFFNGALLGHINGTFSFAGRDRTPGDITLLRYSTFTVGPGLNTTSMSYEGRGRFLLVGDRLASTQSVANVGPIPMPVISIVLWLLAIGAIVAGFLLKPFTPPPLPLFGFTRLIGWIAHGVLLLISLLLWDHEIKVLIGSSLLTLFANGAFGQGVALAIIGSFEIVPLILAFAFFGYPVRFLVNSGLKLVGLKRARGIGKGLGDLAAWLLGAPFIPVFLNVVVGALLKAISGVF